MCSPELTLGLCCICCGTLTPENTHEIYSDLHKGKCAILAGQYETWEQSEEAKRFMGYRDAYVKYSVSWHRATRDYYAFVDRVATEDHYDNGDNSGLT